MALILLPKDPDTLNNLGNLALDRGELERAVEHYEQAIQGAPQQALLHHNLGTALRQLSDHPGAIAALKEAVRLSPGYLDAWIQLGIALGSAGQAGYAADSFRKAIEIDPANLMAWIHLGHTWHAQGLEDKAMIAYQTATRHAPDDAAGYLNLGIAHHNRGQIPEAITAYKHAIQLSPEDGTARHLLNALSGNTSSAAPADYIEELFDHYAEQYDTHLSEKLSYRSPQAMAELVAEVVGSRRFSRSLDLGCGTGLSGAAFSNITETLDGVDLSANMLAQAKERGLYTSLHHSRLLDFLHTEGPRYDLFIAADVLVYIGDLKPLLAAMAVRAQPGALAVLSTEHTEGDGYLLRESGRYAHSRAYLRTAATEAGFSVIQLRTERLRRDQQQWITGDLTVLSRLDTPPTSQ
ncbi:MAG: putative TPR repeat methyltransferase [Myxococcota bacterium]|jgi:predicted TPR repeat methyltransferase